MTAGTPGWISEARARLADRDKPLAPDEGIATSQAEWEGDLYAIAERGLDALDAIAALHVMEHVEVACGWDDPSFETVMMCAGRVWDWMKDKAGIRGGVEAPENYKPCLGGRAVAWTVAQ